MLGQCHEGVMEWFSLFFSAFGPREAVHAKVRMGAYHQGSRGRGPENVMVARFDESLRLFRNGTFECRKAESLNVRGNNLEITQPCRPHLLLAVEPPATQA